MPRKPFEDLTGSTCGRYQVICLDHVGPNFHYNFKCLCNLCGKEVVQNRTRIVKDLGHFNCLPIEKKTKHGDSRRNEFGGKTILYSRWSALVARTTKTYLDCSVNYIERGIDITEKWTGGGEGYLNFKNWAYGKYPNLDELLEQGYELDREDNDKGYSEENCRFVSHKTNMRNQRITKKVEWKGQLLPIGDIIEQENCPYSYGVVSGRLKLGWSMVDTLTVPYTPGKRGWRK
jgi:hypothetical protein